jgi:hypothetical protein
MKTGQDVCTAAVARPGGKNGPQTQSISILTREM